MIKIHLLRFIWNFPRKSSEPTLDSQYIVESIALARFSTQFPTMFLHPSWDTAVWMDRKPDGKNLVEMITLTRAENNELFSECLQQVECLQGSIFRLILLDTLL